MQFVELQNKYHFYNIFCHLQQKVCDYFTLRLSFDQEVTSRNQTYQYIVNRLKQKKLKKIIKNIQINILFTNYVECDKTNTKS